MGAARFVSPLLVAAVASLTACGADHNSTSFRTPPPDTANRADFLQVEPGPGSVPAESSPGSDSVPPESSSDTVPATSDPDFVPIGSVSVAVEPVVSTVTAVDLAVRPGDPALYVVEHDGRVVRALDSETTVVADLRDRHVGHKTEQGLTGLEFSADGMTAWIHYTDAAGSTTVSEVTLGSDGLFDLDTERVLIRLTDPPASNHNAGDLLLAEDGSLLITLGDGDNANDPNRFASDPTTLRGSILRVRPTPGADDPYQIPDDNPFADGPLDGSAGRLVDGAPEVLAWGLRNPWKIDIDPVSGSLWIADVGSADAEEINVVAPEADRPVGWAADFGWSRFEGTLPRNGDVESVLGDPIDPLFSYPHEGIKCAVSGGVVYRGEAIPELWSGYVYADFCEGSVWVLDPTTGTTQRLVGSPTGAGGIPAISGLRTGPDGEVYVLSWRGSVYRLVPA